MVEHGDSLRMHKQAQGGCVAMLERERKIAIRLLITGSAVQSRHNPLDCAGSPAQKVGFEWKCIPALKLYNEK